MSKDDISLKDKIKHTLEETRVVLPGTQAILGFQLVCVFSQGFDKLSQSDKLLHLFSLLMVLMSTIILLTTAPYHRIAEEGRDSERLHRFGSTMLLIGMIFLLIGMTIDFYLISEIITGSVFAASLYAGIIIITAVILWYLYPLWRKKNQITDI